jgi:CDGSH-type Zn-finger protein
VSEAVSVEDPGPVATPTDAPADAAADRPLDDGAVTITPYADGPLIVRGPFRLMTPDGDEIDPRRGTVALCRCGRSALKPFCDGSHKAVGFRAPAGDQRRTAGRALSAVADAAVLDEAPADRPRGVRRDA